MKKKDKEMAKRWLSYINLCPAKVLLLKHKMYLSHTIFNKFEK
jgi:hypothetical protein